MQFPGSMKIGMCMGLLGGLVAFFAMAFLLDINNEPLKTMAVCLLVAVLYFALAGGFSKTSQWNQNVLMAYCFITIGVMIGVTIVEYVPLWFGVIELVLGVIALIASLAGGAKTYLNNPNRA